MARNMLKNYGRFELLELIYNMRKENLELKERCAEAETTERDRLLHLHLTLIVLHAINKQAYIGRAC